MSYLWVGEKYDDLLRKKANIWGEGVGKMGKLSLYFREKHNFEKMGWGKNILFWANILPWVIGIFFLAYELQTTFNGVVKLVINWIISDRQVAIFFLLHSVSYFVTVSFCRIILFLHFVCLSESAFKFNNGSVGANGAYCASTSFLGCIEK